MACGAWDILPILQLEWLLFSSRYQIIMKWNKLNIKVLRQNESDSLSANHTNTDMKGTTGCEGKQKQVGGLIYIGHTQGVYSVTGD